jgi:2,4-dienoyl-CoA reductase-like NADH-dependent reductase (Old Yellow Enzyme family)
MTPTQVAMYEHLASFFGGPPNPYHISLYSKWAKNDWAILITGNVQVCSSHLTLGRDLILPEYVSEETILPYRHLAAAIHENDFLRNSQLREDRVDKELIPTLAIMQLSHAGRQSTNFVGGRWPFKPPLAPSAIPVGRNSHESNFFSRAFHGLLFQTPREMSSSDIDSVIHAFVKGAVIAHQSGFDGIELHVAHGCECFATLTTGS